MKQVRLIDEDSWKYDFEDEEDAEVFVRLLDALLEDRDTLDTEAADHLCGAWQMCVAAGWEDLAAAVSELMDSMDCGHTYMRVDCD